MNFLDAAYSILKQSDTPLHFLEITRRAVQANILDTKGQTPGATMGSRLYVDTKKPHSRFKRVQRNLFTLADQQSNKISQHIDMLNQQTRHKLFERLRTMPPDRFEALVGELLLALGFKEETIQVTSYGSDNGIDVRGVINVGGITEINAAVQVKRWKANIQAPTVQALRGSLVVHEQGIIISTSRFSKGAIQEAQAPGKTRISLVDGIALVELLIEKRVGIKADQYAVVSLDEDWWRDIVPESAPSEIHIARQQGSHILFPFPIRANAHHQEFTAELLDRTGRIRIGDQEYPSPSRAGMIVTGWKSCNGWAFWRYLDSQTDRWHMIEELRHDTIRLESRS